MPIDPRKSGFYSCCCKYICNGCGFANNKREREGRLEERCPFCRKPLPETEEDFDELLMKRVEANDPVALCLFGTERFHEGDYKTAFESWSRAAALGNMDAHHQLSIVYHEGKGVEKDEKRELHHLTEAAIGGHPDARHNLGCVEERRGMTDKALKHFIIAAKLGYDKSLERLKELYKAGLVSKEDLAAALRGYHAAIKATKSPQREEAAKLMMNAA